MKGISAKYLIIFVAILLAVFVTVSLKAVQKSKLLSTEAYTLYLGCKSKSNDLSKCIAETLIAKGAISPKTATALLVDYARLSNSGYLSNDPRMFVPISKLVGASFIKNDIPLTESMAACPNSFDYSCLEGVFTAYYEKQNPVRSKDSALSFCNPYMETSFANKKAFSICTRAMGKELYQITSGPLNSLISQCDSLSISYAKMCAQGIYEAYSTGIPAQNGYIDESRTGTLKLSCLDAPKEYTAFCHYAFASSQLYSPANRNYSEVFTYCSQLQGNKAESCFYGFAQKMYLVTGGQFFKTLEYCESNGTCVGQVLSVFGEGVGI